MDDVLGLLPFVPSREYERSAAFYEAFGFTALHRSATVTVFRLAGFGFILQNFHVEALTANFMLQLLVRDVDAWWSSLDAIGLVARFGVKPPIPPAMQHWGLKVGFVFDPSGVLWHVAERPSGGAGG